ncbi:MAG: TonB family protein [Proteobacteria bacterium]|nr:MAG: TonB family protein [Pseudomonadota bacterium]
MNAEYLKPNGDKETDMAKVERLPSFPGGPRGFASYLQGTLKYPPQARDKGVQGRVMLEFTVTALGEIRNVDVVNSVNVYLDAEAVRVVKMMPNWIPALKFGRPAEVRFKMPLSFQLGSSSPNSRTLNSPFPRT